VNRKRYTRDPATGALVLADTDALETHQRALQTASAVESMKTEIDTLKLQIQQLLASTTPKSN
jgi:hypothetical protein